MCIDNRNYFNIINLVKLRKTQLKGGENVFDYKMLKLKIKEVYDTQEAFADAMDMGYTALNFRLNNKVEWKAPEIAKACELLHIPLNDAHFYFFTLKVEKN